MNVRTSVSVLFAATCLAAPAGGEVLMTRDQALAEAFPRAKVERRNYTLTEAQVKAVQTSARAKLESRIVSAWVATRGDTLAGVAYFDTRIVRTMPATFMTVVAPDTSIARVELLAFHEPSDYRPPARWLDQYDARRLDDTLWPKRGIRNISGATLTARAVTDGARLALALHRGVVLPDLAAARAKSAAARGASR